MRRLIIASSPVWHSRVDDNGMNFEYGKWPERLLNYSALWKTQRTMGVKNWWNMQAMLQYAQLLCAAKCPQIIIKFDSLIFVHYRLICTVRSCHGSVFFSMQVIILTDTSLKKNLQECERFFQKNRWIFCSDILCCLFCFRVMLFSSIRRYLCRQELSKTQLTSTLMTCETWFIPHLKIPVSSFIVSLSGTNIH